MLEYIWTICDSKATQNKNWYIFPHLVNIYMKNIYYNNFTEPVHTFTRALKDCEAEEEGTITLQCQTAQSPTKVTWYKGSTELRSGPHYDMSKKEGILTLTIRQLEEQDSETYTCDVVTAKSTATVIVKGRSKSMIFCFGSYCWFCWVPLGDMSIYSLHETLHTTLARLTAFTYWYTSFAIA